MSCVCPTCTQRIPPAYEVIRMCFDCQLPLDRHDKWKYKKVRVHMWDREGKPHYSKYGRYAVVVVHRHCDNPKSYRQKGADYK